MRSDPLLRLALALHESPGVYALLIGSGVSRAAGIPTVWDIVLDLVRKVAAVEGEDPAPDPVAWYQQKFDEAPTYTALLERLTSTPAERMNLLRSYFEPTDEEREQGLKVPTPAHKAIARLVKDGRVRVILTTNFDRLLEAALDAEAIQPDVIASDDALRGAMPHVHTRCVVVKLHGDYRDTRIRNTPAELERYSRAMNRFLDRVFDEFGLIVCGWSGTWDTALRDAILRCPTRRFTTFWFTRRDLTDEASGIVQHRRAEVINIESADQVFQNLRQYLLGNRKALEQRENGKMRHDRWYGYVYPKNLDCFDKPKLLTPSIANIASFSYDAKGEFYLVGSGGGGGGGYGVTLKAGVRLSPLYILGLLNSKLLDYYLHRTSSRFRGGYWAYSRQYIARLPVRVLDISKSTEKRQHDALVALVRQMLKLQERLVAEGDNRDEDRVQLERAISRTERDIDRLVYDLYGVTPDERRLVENEVSA